MSEAGHNGIDVAVAKRWIGEAMRVYEDLDAQKIENMNTCRKIRSRLPNIYEAAKNAGLPIKAFKLYIREQLLEQKIEGLQADIEALTPDDDEDAETFEQFRSALGGLADTPLGKAAISTRGGDDDDDQRNLRPRHLREKDADAEAAQANVKALKKIKGLPGADADAA